MSNSRRIASQEIKRFNRTRIYNLFLEHGSLTRQDIQKMLDMSLPTIAQNLDELIGRGLIVKSGSVSNTGGRSTAVFSLVKDARLAVGIDIILHYITVVVVDLTGKIVARKKAKTLFSRSDSYYKKLGKLVDETLEENSISRDLILGVGIGLPGLTDAENSTIVYGRILDFNGATADEFGRYIHFPVTIYNDANAACFAELYEIKDTVSNGFYVMLSTNVGGAVFINGDIYTGDELRSGEFGHLIVRPKGKQCYCGSFGCLDPYCKSSNLTSISDGDIDIFFQMLDTGIPEAMELWNDFIGNLVVAIKNVRMLFNCRIILGGFIGAHMENRLDALKEMLNVYNTFDDNYDYIVICKCRDEAIASGAALNHIVPFIQSI